MIKVICKFFLLVFLFPNVLFADLCVYTTRSGKILQANSMQEVPRMYRDVARCQQSDSSSPISNPQDLNLKGNEGNVEMVSPVGKIKLKWSRQIQTLLGRTPQKVVMNSMNTLKRLISSSAFREKLSNMNLDWNIVFMGKDLPSSQIPSYLITNCHPGWMVAPANIYMAVERVYNGCDGVGRGDVGDEELEKVMLHEIGHAVEYQIAPNLPRDLKRSEGFATWFAIYASGYSSIVNQSSVLSYYKMLAKKAIEAFPNTFNFSGSAYDYARASMYFYIVEKKKGVAGILQLYEKLKLGNEFVASVVDTLNTNQEKLSRDIIELVADSGYALLSGSPTLGWVV